jgi:serine protease Do
VLLDEGQNTLPAITNPPRFFTPAKEFLLSLKDPPTPDKPIELPWMGIPRATGLNKDVAAFYGLENQPAVQVNDLIADAPAAKSGLKEGDIILKVNGKPLERGDQPEELWPIFTRNLSRMKPGETVTLSVLRGEKGTPLRDIEITLGHQPPRSNTAKRFYADDLGFAVRDLVFTDKYGMHLPEDQKGVLVALLRPQAAAQTGGLRHNDLITRLDNEPVTDVEHFHKAYDTLRKDKPKQAIVMEVRRGDREDTVRIEAPQ